MDSAGRSELLIVVEEDPVVIDVGQVVRREVVLAGDDALADGLAERRVEVGGQRPLLVVDGELQALHPARGVVEGGVDQRGAELALVLQALHLAVVGVHADGPGRTEVLRDAGIEIVRALGQRRVVAHVRHGVGGAVELGDVRAGDHLGGRRGEVARVAGVHGGAAGGLPDQAQARTQLAFAARQLVAVATQAVVQRPLVADAPLVLHVGRPRLCGEAAVVEDVDRRGAGLVAVGVGREHQCVVAADRTLEAAVDAVAQRVAVAQRHGEVGLQGAGAIAAGDVGGDAVEHQLADPVRRIGEAAVALAHRHLVVGRAQLALQRQHAEAGVLALAFVEVGGVEVDRIEITELRRLVRVVRDLEAVVGDAEQEAQAGVVVDQVADVAEALHLVGVVVDRLFARRGILDAGVVFHVVAGEEPAPAVVAAPDRRVRIQRTVAAAGDADAAAVAQVMAALRGDVDHRRRAQAVLRRQRAIEQLHVVDRARIEALAEAADRLGDDHAVDAVLQIRVVAAHVQAAVGILHHAGRLQQHLVQRRGGAERQLCDRLVVDDVLAAAGIRRQRIARLVQRGRDRDRAEVLYLGRLPVAAAAVGRIVSARGGGEGGGIHCRRRVGGVDGSRTQGNGKTQGEQGRSHRQFQQGW